MSRNVLGHFPSRISSARWIGSRSSNHSMKRHGGCWSGFGVVTLFRKLPERWGSSRTLCPSESAVLGRNSGIPLTTGEERREHRRAMSNERPDELPLEEIFRHMEETAEHDYPNPNRIGCPPADTLEAF